MRDVDNIGRFTMWQYRMVSRIIPTNRRRYTIAEMRWRTAELWLALIAMVALFASTIVPLFFT